MRNLTIFITNKQPNVTGIMPKAAREELWRCFSPHPLVRLNDGRLDFNPVIIDRMVIGVGPTCRGYPWCRPR